MSIRRNYKEIWKEQWVTDEEIKNHYTYQNEKAKRYRERNKEIREKNKDKIEIIKWLLKGTEYKLCSVTNDWRGVFIGERKKTEPMIWKNNRNIFIDWEYVGMNWYCYIDYIKSYIRPTSL